MSREWFIADTHFGHSNVITKMGRDFPCIEEHDGYILEQINSLVDVRDRLRILGDFAWQGKAQKYRGLIRCKCITFIIGNHDKHQDCLRAFGHVHDMFTVRKWGAQNEPLILCHYPLAFWDRSHRGSYHLYGHLHTNREALMDSIWPDRRSLDVGVDNAALKLGNFQPFSKEDLMDIWGSKGGHDHIAYYNHLNENGLSGTGGSLWPN